MGSSKSFGAYVPMYGHLMRGRAGVSGELNTLRDQIDSAFCSLEHSASIANLGSGGNSTPTYIAARALSALHAVSVTTGTTIDYAQPSVGYPLGVTTSSGQLGASITVVTDGDIIDSNWHWTVGSPIGLSADGVLTQQLSVLTVLWIMGGAVSPTHMVVRMSGPFLLG